MKVIELQKYGGAEALQLVDHPEPVVGPGEVLVGIAATSFNPVDSKRASGLLKAILPIRFPFVPGGDFSGVVEAIGEGVTGLRKGDAVYGSSAGGGTYAERVAVDAKRIAIKPTNLSHGEAASLALVGQTAAQAIEAAGVVKGKTVLIHGAGGAVGSVAVQLAHYYGATVIGTASADDAARLLGYGARQVIDRNTRFEDQLESVDVVIDAVGGEVQTRSFVVLKKGGILIALSEPPSQDEARRHGVTATMLFTQGSTASLDALRERIEGGDVVPFVGQHYPLADASHVWLKAAAGGTKGKIVIDVLEGK
ncbi:NADP-dependent oxidoreductase [Burkholderia paludis]|uniref:NADP-dependent oxidoreductase n=1 Tax=Burkholderia paludis TaxID=1506587 RepID=UPI000946C96E|nr:NADP-dependent oxidoreductase [Burkholderia paludis]